jgi:hypothetical protein
MDKKINYQNQSEIAGILADPQNAGLRLKEDAILFKESYLILTDDPYIIPETPQKEIDDIKTQLSIYEKVKNGFNSLLGFLKLKNLDSGIGQVN